MKMKTIAKKIGKKAMSMALAAVIAATSVAWPAPVMKAEAAANDVDGRAVEDGKTMAYYIDKSENKFQLIENGTTLVWTADPDVTYFSGADKKLSYSGSYPDAQDYKVQIVPKEDLGKKIVFSEYDEAGSVWKTNREKLANPKPYYHTYKTKQSGWEMPVLYWRAADNVISSHAEGSPADSEDATTHLAHVGGSGGFEYITANKDGVPCMAAPYTKDNVGNIIPNYKGNSATGEIPAGNSTAWRPTCAWCGQELKFNFYGTQEAWQALPSITLGSWYFYSCRVCGGQEQGAAVTHECTRTSVNKYIVTYDDNTNDPGCVGNTAPQSFFMDRGEYQETGDYQGMYKYVYEGFDYYSDDKVAVNGYVRPGYVFTGWSTAPGGTAGNGITIDEGADSIDSGLLQYVKDNYTVTDANGVQAIANNTAITLYAQWEPVTSDVMFELEDAFHGGAKYEAENIETVTETVNGEQITYYKVTPSGTYHKNGKPSKEGDYTVAEGDYKRNNLVFDSTNEALTLPKGYLATFAMTSNYTLVDSNGQRIETEYSEDNRNYVGYIEATTYVSGMDVRNKNNSLDPNGNVALNENGGVYQYGPRADETDIITIMFDQKPIILPNIKNQNLVGWFDEGDNFVGVAGSPYLLDRDRTLHPKFASATLQINDVYYYKEGITRAFGNEEKDPADANQQMGANKVEGLTPASDLAALNATGAVNVRLQTADSATEMYYNIVKYNNDTNEWEPINNSVTGGSTSEIPQEKEEKTQKDTWQEYIVVADGNYRLTAYGASGGDCGDYQGGDGDGVRGQINLNKGDVLAYKVGTQGGSKGNGYSAGGGYSAIKLKRAGSSTWELLLVAGGGGGATAVEHGKDALTMTEATTAENQATLLPRTTTEADGMAGQGASSAFAAGGGGGYQGGKMGEGVVETEVAPSITPVASYYSNGTAWGGWTSSNTSSATESTTGITIQGTRPYMSKTIDVTNYSKIKIVVTSSGGNTTEQFYAFLAGPGANQDDDNGEWFTDTDVNRKFFDSNMRETWLRYVERNYPEWIKFSNNSGTIELDTSKMYGEYTLYMGKSRPSSVSTSNIYTVTNISLYEKGSWGTEYKNGKEYKEYYGEGNILFGEKVNPLDNTADTTVTNSTAADIQDGWTQYDDVHVNVFTNTTTYVHGDNSGTETSGNNHVNKFGTHLELEIGGAVAYRRMNFDNIGKIEIYYSTGGSTTYNDYLVSVVSNTDPSSDANFPKRNADRLARDTYIGTTWTDPVQAAGGNISGGAIVTHNRKVMSEFKILTMDTEAITGTKYWVLAADGDGSGNAHYYIDKIRIYPKHRTLYDSGYGGSSYINNTAGFYDTSNMMSTSSQGSVTITPLEAGYEIVKGNFIDFLDVEARDKENPNIIDKKSVFFAFKDNDAVLSWREPISGSTNYKYQAGYGNNLGYHAVTSEITKPITSAIAGYYYVCDNNSSEATDYIRSKVGTFDKNYTWETQHSTANELQFTKDNFLPTSKLSSSASYVHIAAVDVAGNVGDAITIEFKTTPVCKIRFNTNKLEYLLDYKNLAYGQSYASWSAPGKAGYVSAPGQNKQEQFYEGYYAINGTYVSSSNTDGVWIENGISKKVAYGGAFPTVSCTGAEFLGWNTKPDGSGQSISYDTFIPGESNSGKTIVLYAIWADKVDSTVPELNPGPTPKPDDPSDPPKPPSTDPSDPGPTVTPGTDATIAKIKKTAVTLKELSIHNGALVPTHVSYTTDNLRDEIWSKASMVTVAGQSQASGIYRMTQDLRASGEERYRINTAFYAARGIAPANGEVPNNRYSAGIFDKTYTFFANGGTDNANVPGMYHPNKQTYQIEYPLQGVYYVKGSSASRTWVEAGNNALIPGRQGYGSYAETGDMQIKIDNTIPSIDYYHVFQERLENHAVGEMESLITYGLHTTFTVEASDYADAVGGPYLDHTDTAGIKKVAVVVYDEDNHADCKEFELTCMEVVKRTKEGNVLVANYSGSFDLYKEFPEAERVIYQIYVIDNAGNYSKALNDLEWNDPNADPNEPQSPLPDSPDIGGETGIRRPIGILDNFTVKTVIYNDENEAYNYAEDQTYFRLGDIGHVEVWTYGYTDGVYLDFGYMGMVMENDIATGVSDSEYRMGVYNDNPDRYRYLAKDIADNMRPDDFVLRTYEDGSVAEVPLAQYYNRAGWLSEGMNEMIPLGYTGLTDSGSRREDGSVIYNPEYIFYSAWASKEDMTLEDNAPYIVWNGAGEEEVHYRVTHEHLPIISTGNEEEELNNGQYTVNYYVKDAGKSTYTREFSRLNNGVPGDTILISSLRQDILGCTFKEAIVNGQTVTSTTIPRTGKRIINMYYERNKYNLSLVQGSGISATSGTGQYQYGEKVTITANQLPGHTWAGWYVGNNLLTNAKTYTFTMPASDVQYMAKATNRSSNVTYHANDGSGATTTVTKANNVVVLVSDFKTLFASQVSAAHASGKHFVGWNTKENGTGVSYSAGSSYALNRHLTLYAQWESHTFKTKKESNPTCTEPGKMMTYCECGYATYTDIAPIGHNFPQTLQEIVRKEIIREANCWEGAQYYAYCLNSGCEEVNTNLRFTGMPLGHDTSRYIINGSTFMEMANCEHGTLFRQICARENCNYYFGEFEYTESGFKAGLYEIDPAYNQFATENPKFALKEASGHKYKTFTIVQSNGEVVTYDAKGKTIPFETDVDHRFLSKIVLRAGNNADFYALGMEPGDNFEFSFDFSNGDMVNVNSTTQLPDTTLYRAYHLDTSTFFHNDTEFVLDGLAFSVDFKTSITQRLYTVISQRKLTKQDLENYEHVFEIAVNGTKLDPITFKGIGRTDIPVTIPASALADGYNLIEMKVVSDYNNLEIGVSGLQYQFKNTNTNRLVSVATPSATHLGNSYKQTNNVYLELPMDGTPGFKYSLCERVLFSTTDKYGNTSNVYCNDEWEQPVWIQQRAWPEHSLVIENSSDDSDEEDSIGEDDYHGTIRPPKEEVIVKP